MIYILILIKLQRGGMEMKKKDINKLLNSTNDAVVVVCGCGTKRTNGQNNCC